MLLFMVLAVVHFLTKSVATEMVVLSCRIT